jgi:hypothetical protein
LGTELALSDERYYDSSLGRFLMRGSGGINAYAAGGNNPTEGMAWGRFIGGLLAGGLGGYYGGLPGAALGVGLWEGLYSYAEGNSLQTAAVEGITAGAVNYAGGRVLGAAGNWLAKTRAGQAASGLFRLNATKKVGSLRAWPQIFRRINPLRKTFRASGGKFRLHLFTTKVHPLTGSRIFAEFDPVTREIFFYRGANIGSAAHELLHYEQALKYRFIGRTFQSRGLSRIQLEEEIEEEMARLGFVSK